MENKKPNKDLQDSDIAIKTKLMIKTLYLIFSSLEISRFIFIVYFEMAGYNWFLENRNFSNRQCRNK